MLLYTKKEAQRQGGICLFVDIFFLINSRSFLSITCFLGEGSMSERREKRTLCALIFTVSTVCHYERERREKITNDDKCRYLLSSAASRRVPFLTLFVRVRKYKNRETVLIFLLHLLQPSLAI